jgi:hypothetical protein
MMTNVGFWLGWAGQRREGEALVRQGLDTAIGLGTRADEAYAHAGLAWVLEMYGDYGPAIRESLAAVELARGIGHREWTGAGLSIVGRIARICGQPARARAVHEEMLGITRELGTALWIAVALGELGADLIALGEEDAGDRLLGEAMDEAGEAVEFIILPLLTRADLLLRRGRVESALDTARRARQMAHEYFVLSLHARHQEARALIALNRLDEGERALLEVRAQAGAVGAAPPMWEACLALADHFTARGRSAEAAAERAEALSWLEPTAEGLPEDLREAFAATPAMRRARGAADC